MSSFLRKCVSVPLLITLLVLSTGCAHIERERNLETLLAKLPIPRVEDPMGDLILDHPVFERNFGIAFENNGAIPPTIDIRMVEVLREGDDYLFRIRTWGHNLPVLLDEGRHVARLGVYVDTDVNGVSDFLLTTTDKPGLGLVVTPEFKIIHDMEDLSIDKDLVILRIPSHLVGDHFDWSFFPDSHPMRADTIGAL